jgi:hypothetical protein
VRRYSSAASAGRVNRARVCERGARKEGGQKIEVTTMSQGLSLRRHQNFNSLPRPHIARRLLQDPHATRLAHVVDCLGSMQ